MEVKNNLRKKYQEFVERQALPFTIVLDDTFFTNSPNYIYIHYQCHHLLPGITRDVSAELGFQASCLGRIMFRNSEAIRFCHWLPILSIGSIHIINWKQVLPKV